LSTKSDASGAKCAYVAHGAARGARVRARKYATGGRGVEKMAVVRVYNRENMA